jgi:hypothetical protein
MVAVYAAGMAWVEAAVVLYLRLILGRMDPYELPAKTGPAEMWMAELVREAATVVMLGAVGWLAGRTWRSRFGHFLVGFGVWDILYYVFLVPMTGWPRSLLDWDILFLLPLPWWGPVWAPVLIAALMITGGVLLALYDSPQQPLWPSRPAIALNVCGTVLALYLFMAGAASVADQGLDALARFRPVRFDWPLFLLAVALMAAPVAQLAHQSRTARAIPTPNR